jgi:hypothetical protein
MPGLFSGVIPLNTITDVVLDPSDKVCFNVVCGDARTFALKSDSGAALALAWYVCSLTWKYILDDRTFA